MVSKQLLYHLANTNDSSRGYSLVIASDTATMLVAVKTQRTNSLMGIPEHLMRFDRTVLECLQNSP